MIDEKFYDYALQFVGTPYKWGGDDFSGFDCSGFVIEILQAAGKFPHGRDTTSQGLFLYYRNKGCQMWPMPKYGRLAFYGKDINHIIHVAFILDSNYVIEAGGGNRNTKTVDDAITDNAYVRVRPFDYRRDLCAILEV